MSLKGVYIAYLSSHFSVIKMLLGLLGAVGIAEAKLETEPQLE